ncbi:hypothetical protein D3C87_1939030 [compost metagenome]
MLIKMGYTYLLLQQALTMCEGIKRNVFLRDILKAQLQKISNISYKGQQRDFTKAN